MSTTSVYDDILVSIRPESYLFPLSLFFPYELLRVASRCFFSLFCPTTEASAVVSPLIEMLLRVLLLTVRTFFPPARIDHLHQRSSHSFRSMRSVTSSDTRKRQTLNTCCTAITVLLAPQSRSRVQEIFNTPLELPATQRACHCAFTPVSFASLCAINALSLLNCFVFAFALRAKTIRSLPILYIARIVSSHVSYVESRLSQICFSSSLAHVQCDSITKNSLFFLL